MHLIAITAAFLFVTYLFATPTASAQSNSIGIKLISISPGEFEMGVDSVPLPSELIKGAKGVTYDRLNGLGDYDESPVHHVKITKSFLISETEITAEQYRQFKPDFKCDEYWAPAAVGVSWHDATAFCVWLSKKEGKTYRLPTEAEWEYVCRAGSKTPFSSGQVPLEPNTANAWGVKNVHSGPPEWCNDWHGLYSAQSQTDPVGPESGIAKVVRGGGLDFRQPKPEDDTGKKMPAELPYFRRSANRASAPPCFASVNGHIGFRIVQGDLPTTKPTPARFRHFSSFIKQDKPDLKIGPDPTKPYYQTRPLFPSLGENDLRTGWQIGLEPGLGMAYHNSAVEQCDNGDLVAAYYNATKWEDDPEQTVLTMRLRYGATEWDLPEPWPDFADAADAAPIFWNDGKGTLWFFFGSSKMLAGPPFWYMTSRDNGATWSEVQMPNLLGEVGKYSPQPINSVLRDRDGTIYIAIDGEGSTTALFATSDNGKTWRDTGGRTNGRHTSFVLGADGKTLIGYGGKNSNIDGCMPISISTDGGRTFSFCKSEFKPLASGQRPSVIRLQSGRLFFVADTLSSKEPGGRTASYVALSSDEGKTWTQRILPINSTVGYVTAIQTENGVIHIVTSKSKPTPFHIELNENWILNGGDSTPSSSTYLLDGLQTFYNADGTLAWSVNYSKGRKIDTESCWDSLSRLRWIKEHLEDGTQRWQTFDPDRNLKAESIWDGKVLKSFKILEK